MHYACKLIVISELLKSVFLSVVVLRLLLVGTEDLDGGEALDPKLAAQRPVLVSVHSTHLRRNDELLLLSSMRSPHISLSLINTAYMVITITTPAFTAIIPYSSWLLSRTRNQPCCDNYDSPYGCVKCCLLWQIHSWSLCSQHHNLFSHVHNIHLWQNKTFIITAYYHQHTTLSPQHNHYHLNLHTSQHISVSSHK